MKKNTTLIVYGLLILVTFLMTSCSHKKESHSLFTIPVEKEVGNYSVLNLSEYATEIRYIPLETTQSSLISELRNIQYEDGKILIRSRVDNCFLFDDKGMFCRQIGQVGQGPGDYRMICQTLLHGSCIYLMDIRKMLIYDIDGQMKGEYRYQPDVIPSEYTATGWFQVLPIHKDTFVMNVASMGVDYPKALLFETRPSDIKLVKEYPNYIKLDKQRMNFNTDEVGIMYRYKDEIRMYKVINDTIFTINQQANLKEAFLLKLGKYKPELSLFEGGIDDIIAAWNKYIIPSAIFESDNYLFISFSFGKYAPEPIESINRQGGIYAISDVYSVFDKQTGKLILMNQPTKGKLGFKNDIDNGPAIWPKYISSKNEMVACISVDDFMEAYAKIENPTLQLTEVAKKVAMEDNPILAIVKLKE